MGGSGGPREDRRVSERSNLPTLGLNGANRDASWDEAPPDPLVAPELYDGVLWRRVFAYMLDVVLIAAATVTLWFVSVILGILSFGILWPAGVVALAVLPVAYHTCFVGRHGATPGMTVFDLTVRSWTGQRPDYAQAFLLTVLFYVSVALTAWLVLVVALFNRRRRTLHDVLAGTVTVRRSRLGTGQPLEAQHVVFPR
ncbi:MAG: RDD family protein [Alphaproteobacteria bacterium]|nr:MAG: RDD family protein [Alphaproteobacteria bacterium]